MLLSRCLALGSGAHLPSLNCLACLVTLCPSGHLFLQGKPTQCLDHPELCTLWSCECECAQLEHHELECGSQTDPTHTGPTFSPFTTESPSRSPSLVSPLFSQCESSQLASPSVFLIETLSLCPCDPHIVTLGYIHGDQGVPKRLRTKGYITSQNNQHCSPLESLEHFLFKLIN